MYLICQTEQIADRHAKNFDTPAGDVIGTQRDGMFYAYLNKCPHLNINLEFQENQFMDMDGEYLMCANHGALFMVETGNCVFGPCANQTLTKINIEVHSDGGIYLTSTI